MKKYPVLLCVILSSCTGNGSQKPATLQDEVVEMNWNYAVKDLYLLEVEADEPFASK